MDTHCNKETGTKKGVTGSKTKHRPQEPVNVACLLALHAKQVQGKCLLN